MATLATHRPTEAGQALLAAVERIEELEGELAALKPKSDRKRRGAGPAHAA